MYEASEIERERSDDEIWVRRRACEECKILPHEPKIVSGPTPGVALQHICAALRYVFIIIKMFISRGIV